MPVAGDHSPAIARTAGTRRTTSAPSTIATSAPLIAAWRAIASSLATSAASVATSDAQPRLEATGRIVQPSVDHPAVARRGLLTRPAVALEHRDRLTAPRE